MVQAILRSRFIVLVGLAIVLIVLVGVYFWRLKTLISQQEADKQTVYVQNTDKLTNTGKAPVRAIYKDDGKEITYEIIGSFENRLLKDGSYLRGNFIIESDPLARQLPVFMGDEQGLVYVGIDEKEDEAGTIFRLIKVEAVEAMIEPGERVVLTQKIPADATAPEGNYTIAKNYLDKVIGQYNSGNFDDLTISSFTLTPDRIEVVR